MALYFFPHHATHKFADKECLRIAFKIWGISKRAAADENSERRTGTKDCLGQGYQRFKRKQMKDSAKEMDNKATTKFEKSREKKWHDFTHTG